MTEKQFEIICEDSSLVDIPVYVISDDKLEFDIYGSEKDAERLCTVLNENEQLKQIMKGVYDLLFEEVDVFTDKAIEHDINAYIELKELDNKDAYYMAIATKKAIKMLKECIK